MRCCACACVSTNAIRSTDISIGGSRAGRIVFNLFDGVPRTTENTRGVLEDRVREHANNSESPIDD